MTSDAENSPTPQETDLSDFGEPGELANRLNFIWWADDGDNVLEEGETVLPGGPIGALGVNGTATVVIADGQGSIYNSGDLSADGALIGEDDYFIGKAWCFGTLTPGPLPQDGGDQGRSPADPAGGGILCDGSGETNVTQTDSLTADVTFRAVQARNNETFDCKEDVALPTPTPSPSPSPEVSPSPSPE